MCRPPITVTGTPSYPDLQVTSEMHPLNVLMPHSRSNGNFSLRHGTGCPQGGPRAPGDLPRCSAAPPLLASSYRRRWCSTSRPLMAPAVYSLRVSRRRRRPGLPPSFASRSTSPSCLDLLFAVQRSYHRKGRWPGSPYRRWLSLALSLSYTAGPPMRAWAAAALQSFC
jgi:hypothetical protein